MAFVHLQVYDLYAVLSEQHLQHDNEHGKTDPPTHTHTHRFINWLAKVQWKTKKQLKTQRTNVRPSIMISSYTHTKAT